MRGDKKSILFKLEDMTVDEIQSFNIVEGADVSINGVLFNRNVISRVEIIKYKSSIALDDENIFIKLFMGHIKLGTIVTKGDYVLELEQSKFPSFMIRKAESFDYTEEG